ncbi:MAG: response regulator receiver modulated diguanylate cyclase [Candidatus Magnetoglobus multicellularis str. Araruama]|uniref:diguanylate cyclase n=1 Tax=Candidatus Magnetoglobus multicellularis str. Araruama TaxID=890399 RepID=A0A1V1P2U1_9BACT|nr:MAG: response regulator receiver modulated diguanylate cyclase [Candidatus Magnetoglobus multicellularis str. Araruama]
MSKNVEQAKVLIVDDEKMNLDVLVGLLKPHYRTVAAKSGEQAFKRLEIPPLPDLILLDIMMPGMDGYEVCRKLKDDKATRDIPIIFITGKNDVQYEAKGFQAGAVDYITKPFSPLIALARVKTHIELKRRGDMLERLAGLDGLTGIPNRRQFDQFLAAEWKRSIRYNHTISLIIMDIDYFKLYNDHYGHADGDDCLKKVAKSISRTVIRSTDLSARYGGEEFACILPETDFDGAMATADRIMKAILGLGIPHEKSHISDHVTVSIGVASLSPQENEKPHLFD